MLRARLVPRFAPLLGAALLAALGLGPARVEAPAPADADGCGRFDHSHAAWSAFLARWTRDGRVDYAGLNERGSGELDAYLRSLASACSRHYGTWSRDQRLAFWINAYNAWTLRLVLDSYPVKSIRSIGLLPGSAFRRSFVSLPRLGRGKLSLDDIEHTILRKELREPRIHFAIVCASEGCPPLRAEAYRADAEGVLGRQLDEQARGFLRDPSRTRWDPRTRRLQLSPILSWFREDFEAAAGSLRAFVARYSDEATAASLGAGDVDIEFLDYDWSLNQAR